MTIEAKIEDIRIDIDHDGEFGLTCAYREGGSSWPAQLCHWGKVMPTSELKEFIDPETWSHNHYVQRWNGERGEYYIREFEK